MMVAWHNADLLRRTPGVFGLCAHREVLLRLLPAYPETRLPEGEGLGWGKISWL